MLTLPTALELKTTLWLQMSLAPHAYSHKRHRGNGARPFVCTVLYLAVLLTHSQQWSENIIWKIPERRKNHIHLTFPEGYYYTVLLYY